MKFFHLLMTPRKVNWKKSWDDLKKCWSIKSKKSSCTEDFLFYLSYLFIARAVLLWIGLMGPANRKYFPRRVYSPPKLYPHAVLQSTSQSPAPGQCRAVLALLDWCRDRTSRTGVIDLFLEYQYHYPGLQMSILKERFANEWSPLRFRVYI